MTGDAPNAPDLDAAPRTCKTRKFVPGVGVEWHWKRRFASQADAQRSARKTHEAYPCTFCQAWHLATVRPPAGDRP